MNNQSPPKLRRGQQPLPLGLHPRSTFAAFAGGDSRLLVPLLKRLAEGRTAGKTLPQAFVWGPPQCGKTHLLQASCRHAAEFGRSAAFVNAGNGCLVEATAASEHPPKFLAVDAVDLADRDSEKALFSVLEQRRRLGLATLVTARSAPAHLHLGREDLRTRLGWGAVVRVNPLDEPELRRLLGARAEDHGLILDEQVLDYLTARIDRAPGAALACIESLSRLALAEKRTLTVPFIRQAAPLLSEDA